MTVKTPDVVNEQNISIPDSNFVICPLTCRFEWRKCRYQISVTEISMIATFRRFFFYNWMPVFDGKVTTKHWTDFHGEMKRPLMKASNKSQLFLFIFTQQQFKTCDKNFSHRYWNHCGIIVHSRFPQKNSTSVPLKRFYSVT